MFRQLKQSWSAHRRGPAYLSAAPDRRRWLKRIVWSVGLLLLSGVLALGTINYYITRTGQAYQVKVEAAPTAEVAIVLGALVHPNGQLSSVVRDRVERGVQLYHQRKVRKLLLTGDHGRVSYDEVNSMARYALARGVPEEDLFLDHAGFSTYESMYRARDVFRVKRALVVTQEFHLARSVYTARALGLEAWGVESNLQTYPGERYFAWREVLARVKAWTQLHLLHSRPTYLGPALPISGDGRQTQDRPLRPRAS